MKYSDAQWFRFFTRIGIASARFSVVLNLCVRKVGVFDEWPSVHPRTETTVRIHNTRNTRPTQNELQVPSPPGRESVREYTSLASLTAMQLISGRFFISFQTPVLTFLNTR